MLLVSVPGLGESLWGPVKKENGEKEKGDDGGGGDDAGAAAAVASPAPSPSSISRARALLPSLAVLGEPLSCIARTPDLRPAQAMDLLFSVPKAAATPEQLQQRRQQHAKRKREEGESNGGGGGGGGGGRGGGRGGDSSSGAGGGAAAAGTSNAREEGAKEAPSSAAAAAAADGDAKTPSSPSPHHHHHHHHQQQRPPPRAPFHPPHLPPPHHYTLTREIMVARDYPLPHVTPEGAVLCPPGFVSTRPKKEEEEEGRKEEEEKEEEQEKGDGPTATTTTTTTTTTTPPPPPSSPPHLVAIDCEMCETEQGFELARVSAVAPDGSVLLDELVRPARRVLNYHTRFSGITAEKLSGVETTLERAREMLLELVHAETVLVGHALENDLRALRLLHARVVDTGVLYPHPAGPPYRTALRTLSYKFLRRTIQEGDHDSVDDARAAMDLALLKFSRGPAFGATPMAGGAGGVGGVYQRGERLLKVLSDAGKRSTLIDRPEFVNRHVSGRASGIPAGTDGERASRAAREVASGGSRGGGGSATSVNLVWTQLTGLARLQQARADAKRALVVKYAEVAEAAEKKGEEGAAKKPPLPPLFDGCKKGSGGENNGADGDDNDDDDDETFDDPFELETTLRQIDAHLNTLITAAPANTLVVVVTCHGDTAETRRLQEQAWRRAQGLDHLPRWSLQAETHLASVRSAGMRGLCFCGVKQ